MSGATAVTGGTAVTAVSDWLMTGPPWWLVIGTGAIVGASLAFLRWVLR